MEELIQDVGFVASVVIHIVAWLITVAIVIAPDWVDAVQLCGAVVALLVSI